jgi:6-pyruvoyltetrahydropterin/6-carboxytetrahydropterin synthase
MKWIIDKEFAACFGHRVHNQRLDTRFTEDGNGCLACRHLHGHQMIIKVFLESTNIDENDMVTDFKHLGWFKNFIDDIVDHKFMMDLKDPLFMDEFPLVYNNSDMMIEWKEGYWTPHMAEISEILENLEISDSQKQAIFEKYEGAVFVDFVPTSERLTEWLFHIVEEKMKDLPNVTVNAVEYWETPKSHSRFGK